MLPIWHYAARTRRPCNLLKIMVTNPQERQKVHLQSLLTNTKNRGLFKPEAKDFRMTCISVNKFLAKCVL